jgi:uncharacterized protein
MATLLIAGGSGMIGQHFIRQYQDEYTEIRLLSRTENLGGKIKSYAWNPAKGEYDPRAFQNLDYLINLAGAGIADKPWTAERRKLIIDSRVDSLNTLLKALQETGAKPKMIVTASATGFYGDRGEEIVDEQSSPGASDSFLASTTQRWEEAALGIDAAGYPLAVLRIGIVLSMEGGALPKLLMPLKVGMANYFGDGKPYTPWIHIDDITAMFAWLLKEEKTGIWNGTAPHPVSGKALAEALAKAKGGWMTAPVPAFLLKIGLGSMSETVLTGAKVSSQKAVDAGFKFKYERIDAALANLLV